MGKSFLPEESRAVMRTSIRLAPWNGYTFIELLVVIAIIAILIGLLLPAVQKVREAANRIKCANNLKQLGLAAQYYHNSFDHFPPGIGYYPIQTNGTFGTYFYHLLPFLEQDSLFREGQGVAPFQPPVGPTAVFYPGNHNVFARKVALFLCPSDPSVGSDGVVMIDGASFGASCYAPNSQISGENNTSVDPPTSTPQGRTRITEITDGTSQTILHAEKYARCSNTFMMPAFQNGGTAWAYCTAGAFPWLPPPMTLPGKAYQPGFAIAALAARGAPNAIGLESRFQQQPIPFLENCDPTRTATAHAGGMQTGLADGSVRTLAPTMSGATWWAAVTKNGEEKLSSEW